MRFLILMLLSCVVSGCAAGILGAGAGSAAYVANQEIPVNQQGKDLHIKANIQDKLLRSKLSYFKNVQIEVINGDVLLMGFVESKAEQNYLTTIAKKVKYAVNVYDRTVIMNKYRAVTYFNDSLIANMIRTRMVFSKNTYLSKLNVDVFNGVVYISGVVANDAEKAAAEQIARTGKGVIRVISFVHVKNT